VPKERHHEYDDSQEMCEFEEFISKVPDVKISQLLQSMVYPLSLTGWHYERRM
jgi:hypothetical protein